MTIAVRIPGLEHWLAQVKCQSACPVRTDSGLYAQLIAQGRYDEAYEEIRRPNPFASVCARVCAAPCEDACRRKTLDAPVALRALKRFVTERCGVESLHPVGAWHIAHFKNPAALVPSSVMPELGLTDEQAQALSMLMLSWRKTNLPAEYRPEFQRAMNGHAPQSTSMQQ